MLKYIWSDAVTLAIDMAGMEPENYPDSDKLANELGEEMQAENESC